MGRHILLALLKKSKSKLYLIEKSYNTGSIFEFKMSNVF